MKNRLGFPAILLLIIGLIGKGEASAFSRRQAASDSTVLALEVIPGKGGPPNYLTNISSWSPFQQGPGLEPAAETPLTPTIPKLISKVESIAAEKIEAMKTARPSYKATLKNRSGKNVAAMSVELFIDGRRRMISLPEGGHWRSLVPGGGTYEFEQPGIEGNRLAPVGQWSGSLQDQELVVTAVVFEDKSFEGDPETAARFIASRLGRKEQIARILSLIRNEQDSAAQDVQASIERLRRQLSSLDTEMSPAEIVQIKRLVPGVKGNFKFVFESSMEFEKRDFLEALQHREIPRSRPLELRDYRAWLAGNAEKFERWLARL
jgi:hypothetical protein